MIVRLAVALIVTHGALLMRCYYHQVRPAVGICKACGRGVCEDCAVDLERALACRDRCEDEAHRLLDLIDSSTKNAKQYQTAQETVYRSQYTVCVLAAVVGALIAIWCFSLGRHFIIGGVLGLLFTVFGLFGVYHIRSAQRQTH